MTSRCTDNLSQLIAGLKDVRVHFDVGNDSRGLGAGYALAHVLYYFDKEGVDKKLLNPIYVLFAGLFDEIKITSEPDSVSHGPLIDQQTKVWAAASVHLLIEAKVGKEESCKRVFRKIAKSQAARKRGVTPRTIYRWRRRLKNNHPDTNMFWALVHAAKSIDPGRSAQETAELFLNKSPLNC